MIFKVQLMRCNGRRLSWLEIGNGPYFVGNLMTVEGRSKEESYRVAKLVAPGPLGKAEFPNLYEPSLASIAPQAMILRGFERLRERQGYCAVVQECYCVVP